MEEYQKKLAAMKALREQSQKNLNTSSVAVSSPSPAGSPMKPPPSSATPSVAFTTTPTSTPSTPTPAITKTPSHPSPVVQRAVPAFQKTSSSPSLNSLTAKSPAASPGGSPTASPSSSFIAPSSPKPAPPVRERSASAATIPKSNSLLNFTPGNTSTPTKPSPLSLSSSYTPKPPPSTHSSFSTPTTPTSTATPSTPTPSTSTSTPAPTTPSATPSTPVSTPNTPTTTNGKPPKFTSEVEDLKYKLEVETKSRHETERRYQEKVRELAMVKMELQRSQLAEVTKGLNRPPTTTAATSLNNGGAVPRSNSRESVAVPRSNSRESVAVPRSGSRESIQVDPTRKSTRMSKRVSTKPPNGAPGAPRMSLKPATRKSLHVASQLTSLVSEITKIEMAVQAAHAAREEAEERLYDICVEKLSVDAVLKRAVQTLFSAEGCMRTITDPKLTQVRNEIVETIAYVVKECGVEITQATPDTPSSAPIPALPVAPEPLAPAGRIPPPPPTGGARSLAGSQSLGSSTMSLLEQIRSGKSLRQIDLQKLKEEKDTNDKKKRKSIKQLRSLTDTLREALFARADDLLGGDEDSGDEEWDEDWME